MVKIPLFIMCALRKAKAKFSLAQVLSTRASDTANKAIKFNVRSAPARNSATLLPLSLIRETKHLLTKQARLIICMVSLDRISRVIRAASNALGSCNWVTLTGMGLALLQPHSQHSNMAPARVQWHHHSRIVDHGAVFGTIRTSADRPPFSGFCRT